MLNPKPPPGGPSPTPNMNESKTCCSCHVEKSIQDFNKDKHTKSGKAARCRLCTSKMNSDQYKRRKAAKLQAKPQAGE